MASRAPTSLLFYTSTSHLIGTDRKSTRLNSSHSQISYAVFCLKKKKTILAPPRRRVVSPPVRSPSVIRRRNTYCHRSIATCERPLPMTHRDGRRQLSDGPKLR